MKFDKLYRFIVEAKDTKPGQRYFTAMNNAGPSNTPSASPVGRADNFELPTPVSKWDFNPEMDMDKTSLKKQSQIWKVLTNAFSLLQNDKNFQDEIKTIANNFDKKRDSYKNVIGIVDAEGKVSEYEKYDEESRVNTLPQTIDKQISRRTGYEAEIKKRNTILNYAKMGPSAKFGLEREIELLRQDIKLLEKEVNADNVSWGRKQKLEAELIYNNKKLGVLEDRLQSVNISDTTSIKAEIHDFKDKIIQLDKKIEKNQEELQTLTDRTTKIQAHNEENNDQAIEEFKDQVNTSAKRIKNLITSDVKDSQLLNTVDDIDWENVPKDMKTKIKMLDSLESNDPNINPIFGYMESFNRRYYDDYTFGEENPNKTRVKDLDEREFNPQLNITKIRDYMSLPFVRLMSIYSNVGASKMSLKPDVDLNKHQETFTNFMGYINQFPNTKDPVEQLQQRKAWIDPETKEMLRSFVAGMGMEDKTAAYSAINRPWGVTRSGLNSFHQLKSTIESDMKRFIPKTESFDDIFGKLITEKSFNEDDFKLDMIRTLSYLNRVK